MGAPTTAAGGLTPNSKSMPASLPRGVSRSLLALAPSASGPAVLEALGRNQHAKELVREELAQVTFFQHMQARIRSALLLCALAWTVPYSVGGVICLCIWGRLQSILNVKSHIKRRRPSGPVRTAVVTGAHMTKGLHTCRHLHRAGWRVVAVDYHKWWMGMARFSTSVSAFHTVPDAGVDEEGYMKAIARIVHQEGATLVVPVAAPNHSIYDSLVKDLLPLNCRTLALDAELAAVLDDKAKYSELCQQIGVRVPPFWRITGAQKLRELNGNGGRALQGRRYLLKSISYDPKHRSDLFTLPCEPARLERYLEGICITPQSPWMLQRVLDGPEYSCYSLAHKGRVVAHADNRASLSCLNFGHTGSKEIREWVEKFCAHQNLTGHVCFDFMQDTADGHLYTIECNPRSSTVLCAFHDHPAYGQAIAEPSTVNGMMLPLAGSPPVYWFWNEAYTVLKTWNVKSFLLTLAEGVDAVFQAEDPLPFLALHYLQAAVLLLRNARTGRPWSKLDLCIGKLSELGGD